MDTQEVVRQYLLDELLRDQDDVGLDDSLLIGGLVDSLGIMRLIAFIEQRFDIRVPPEDVTIEHFRTIRVIGAYIKDRSSAPVTTNE